MFRLKTATSQADILASHFIPAGPAGLKSGTDVADRDDPSLTRQARRRRAKIVGATQSARTGWL